MLRFYQDFCGRLLLLLLYVRDRWGDEVLPESERYGFDHGFPDRGTSEVVARLEGESDYKTVSSLIDPLVEQLAVHQTRAGTDKDLIDTFVRILQLSFIKNRLLSQDFIRRLRAAILLPSELLGLKERLKKHELYCTECQKPLMNGEMVSICHNREEAYLMCSRCFYPTYVACPSGKHALRAPKGLEKMLRGIRKESCEQCEAEKLGATAVVATGGILATGRGAGMTAGMNPGIGAGIGGGVERGPTGRLEPTFDETATLPRPIEAMYRFMAQPTRQARQADRIQFTPMVPTTLANDWAVTTANQLFDNPFTTTPPDIEEPDLEEDPIEADEDEGDDGDFR